jgi:aminoglycoside phosphotransferase (APT) family kinase protein
VASPPGLDLVALSRYLERHGHPSHDGWRAALIEGGRSNLTYFLTDGVRDWVLRRPPLAHVLVSAHDVAREHRLISALDTSAVPVPRPVLLCTDESVLGAPFYVMQRVQGRVFHSRADFAALSEPDRRAIAYGLVDVLAALHTTDPAHVGLADLGRPQGFLERQVRRWTQQLESSRSRDVAGIDDLRQRLGATVPDSSHAGIVHGDYRLDNVIVGDDDKPAAVVDWEMATLGDTWADVALFALFWDGLPNTDHPLFAGLSDLAGAPSSSALLERYVERTKLPAVALDWYLGLACFKLAVILEGIYFRAQMNKTVGSGFEAVGDAVDPLVQHGLELVSAV